MVQIASPKERMQSDKHVRVRFEVFASTSKVFLGELCFETAQHAIHFQREEFPGCTLQIHVHTSFGESLSVYSAISLRTISDLPLTFSNSPPESKKEKSYLFQRRESRRKWNRTYVVRHVLGYRNVKRYSDFFAFLNTKHHETVTNNSGNVEVTLVFCLKYSILKTLKSDKKLYNSHLDICAAHLKKFVFLRKQYRTIY